VTLRENTRRFGPPPPPSAAELAEGMLRRCRPWRSANELVDRFGAQRYSAPAPLARAADLALCTVLGNAWQRGWQPVDLWRLAQRRLGEPGVEFTLGAIAAEATRYAEAGLDPRWRAQLTALGTEVWWDRSEPYVAAWGRRAGLDRPAAMEMVFRALLLLHPLPREPVLIPPPGTLIDPPPAEAVSPTAVDPKILVKVRALLAKAESTEFTEEADAFFAKAQELMSRYSLERAALYADTARADSWATGGRRIWLDQPYLSAKSHLVGQVAKANRCRSVFYQRLGFVTVIGDETDVEIVELLVTSLLVQAGKAMLAAGRQVDRWGQSRTKSFRRAFLMSYAQRIGERLREASAGARAEVAASIGDDRLLPVLVARERAVERRFAELYPNVSSRRTTVSNSAGWTAGRAAADLAVLDVRRAVRG
jgi:Protein of unknown function (DUF2786)